MLCLTRKMGESILIGKGIEIKVLKLERGRVSIGIEAPQDLLILRKEAHDKSGKQERKNG